MTPEIRKILLGLLTEYDASLCRTQGEKDLMKCIEARAVTECGITVSAFKAVATALWKNKATEVQKELDDKAALFDAVRNASDEYA